MTLPELGLLHREPPMRWAVIITAMQDAGYSLRQIGSALAVPHSTVQAWQRGACPNFEDGRALLTLFELARPFVPSAVRIA